MSQTPETEEAESEATKTSDESAYVPEDLNQRSNTTVENRKAAKPTGSRENEVDSKNTNRNTVSSEETSQESNKQSIELEKPSKVESEKFSKERLELEKPRKEKLEPEKPSMEKLEQRKSNQQIINSPQLSQEQVKILKSSQEQVEIPESSQIEIVTENKTSQSQTFRRFQVPDSIRQILISAMTGFFQFNPNYFIQMRGISNILHISFSLTDIILLAINCQLRPYAHSPSEGFYCKPPETFLFIVACSSFFTATLFLFSCVLSKATDFLLFHSSFEVNYYVLYFIMLLTASLTLIVSEMNWGAYNGFYEKDYESSQIAAIIGLINCILYGISAIGYFMNHRLYREDIIGIRNQL